MASFSIPFLILAGFYVPAEPITYLTAPYAYFVVPLIDLLIGKDRNNVIKADFDHLVSDRYFDILVYMHVYLQYALLVWGVYIFSTHELSLHQQIGLMVSQGIYSATIINVAHELGHRNSPIAIWYAKAALVSVFYHHFIIEHNRGHHVRVATPEDPATARKNENLYAFWWRSITGSFASAWNIQKKLNSSDTPFYRNPMLIGLLASPFLYLTFFGTAGLIFQTWKPGILAFLLIQALIAILLLEVVNYIEHYGMLRRKLENGRYEKVNPLHSWNANHFFSNLILFNLQRHSDHHAYASRPYQVLRHFDQSPQLPLGYPLMIIMALFPPVWFTVMNKKLDNWKAQSVDSSYIKQVIQEFA